MRFIRTTNAFVEFIEADNSGKILSSRGFQMGTVYFQIKNGKVTFYLNDTENPYQNDVWTTNIPLIIDNVEYATEDEVSNALHHIMNDTFQEKLDELKEDLAAETARAEASEAALDDAIDDERDRATSAEAHLQDNVTELSGLVATYDDRIESVEDGVSAVTTSLNAEVARATSKDAAHDTAISGLTTSVNNEIARALSAETSLHNEVLSEASRAQAAESGITANLNAEVSRATTRENTIDDKIDAEVLRSTTKEAAIDAEISGITADIDTLDTRVDNEISRAAGEEQRIENKVDAETTRAIAAESGLSTSLNAETSAREAADGVISGAVDTLSTGLSNEAQRAQNAETVLTTSVNAVSGTVQNEITRAQGIESGLRNDLNAEVSARTTADAAQLQRITALEVGKADANSVYTKTESDTLLAAKADKANAVATAEYVSANKTINFKNINGTVLSTIDATPFVVDGMLDSVSIVNGNLVFVWNTDSGKQTVSIPLSDIFNPDNYYNKTQSDALLATKLNTSDFNTYSGITKTAIDGKLNTSDFNTYSAATENVLDNVYLKSETSGATQISSALAEKLDATAYTPTDLSNYYTKDETSGKTEISSALAEKLAVSSFNTYSGNVATALSEKASQATVDTLSGVVTSHTSNADVHVTTSDKQTWNEKQNALTAGDGIDITYDVISVTGGGITSGEVQSMIDESISGKVNVSDNIVDSRIFYKTYESDISNKEIEKFELYLKDAYDVHTTYQLSIDVLEKDNWVWHNIYPNFNFSDGTYNNVEDSIITIVWDSEKHCFKVSISDSAPANTIFYNLGNASPFLIKVIRFVANSGQTADVVENDVYGLIEDLYSLSDNSLEKADLTYGSKYFSVTNTNNLGKTETRGLISLDDLKIDNDTLKTNIEVGTGVSAWTNVELTSVCEINNLPTNKFRISGDTTDMENVWSFYLSVKTGYCNESDRIWYDNSEQRFYVYSEWYQNEITLDWDAQNGVLTVEYPASSTRCSGAEAQPIVIATLGNYPCKLGSDIKSIECYVEIYLPIKDYVQATKADVNALSGTVATKQNQLTAGTGISIQNDVISVTASSPSVDAYTKAEADAKFATITNFNTHSGNTDVHVTASEKNTWNAKSDFSGSYNDLTNKPTIPTSASQLTNDAGYITSNDITGKTDTTAFTAHTGDTTAHVTSNEKQTWNNKPSVWSGSEQQWAAISGGTLDNNTIYLIY